MLTLNQTDKINEEALFSALMSTKNTAARFRLDYTLEQALAMLRTACRVEVQSRCRTYNETPQFLKHISDVARWITATDNSSFGLFLCGGAGNGKTTILRALHNVVNFVRRDERFSSRDDCFPLKGFSFVPAKNLVQLAKAYANPTRENEADAALFKRLRNIEILAIDDLGQEPKECIHYGDFLTPAIDIISSRYDNQLCTLISSNLTPPEIASYYDERIADRFREMMTIVNFGNEVSFRKSNNA